MGGTIINHMLYADNILIVSLSSSGLQQLLNICNDYCGLHDLTFNARKPMCMYFSIDLNKLCRFPVIYLGYCVGQFVKEVKYLGVMIHSMKTTIDVARQTRKFYMQAKIYCYATSGIALMMSSAHCSRHIVLICIVVSCGLPLRKAVQSSYPQASSTSLYF